MDITTRQSQSTNLSAAVLCKRVATASLGILLAITSSVTWADVASRVHGTTPVVAAAQARMPQSDAAMNTAMEQYRQERYSNAYVQFAKLADQGNAEAARIALIMLRYGRRMYGTEWGASQPQIDLWIRLASRPGEPMSSETGD